VVAPIAALAPFSRYLRYIVALLVNPSMDHARSATGASITWEVKTAPDAERTTAV
jgi:hypothetical protein